ncbi:MAG: phosphoglucomutase/phosphomannomutase family protein [Acidobacteria bacterium]|nr:phosphoglucomutase/phosphomannomutase family protein [Acidobacteriota bacterium]
MAHKQIRFGTSGWRGIIAEDFTFDNVRAAVAAIGDYVCRQNPRNPRVLVGYDTRFFSDEFARTAVEVLSRRGVHCFLCKQPTPTPTIAYEIRRRKTDGGINFTASHNPPEYNGLKFSTPDGAPALPEVTRQLEQLAAKYLERQDSPARPGEARGHEEIDPRPSYLDMLGEKIVVDEIKRAGLKVVYDPLYGTGAGYVDRFLTGHGIEVHAIHAYRDVLFGGHAPEPAEHILADLRQAMAARGAHLGLSTDGDADRFGMLDRDGRFVSANHIVALLFDYLLETRPHWPRGVARSVATTHLVDAVARHHKATVHETPVGFKYIGELIQQDKIIIGGEESAGLSIYGHVPEKDGILACLLVAEMVGRRQASLLEQLEALFRKVGAYYPVRVNLHLDAAIRDRLAERIRRDPKNFNGRRVAGVNRTDGLKLLFDDDSWVLMRLSGTEPVVRCYCESHSEKDTAALVEAAKKFVLE